MHYSYKLNSGYYKTRDEVIDNILKFINKHLCVQKEQIQCQIFRKYFSYYDCEPFITPASTLFCFALSTRGCYHDDLYGLIASDKTCPK